MADQLPVLHMTVGLPKSGKSTWARTQHGVPIVNPDSIRLAIHGMRFVPVAEPLVWAIAKIMVAALFLAGHSRVILDACSQTPERRAEWKDARWLRAYVPIETSAELCLDRARSEGDYDIVPVIERMAGALVWPQPEEFD
jgi:predicted kinase